MKTMAGEQVSDFVMEQNSLNNHSVSLIDSESSNSSTILSYSVSGNTLTLNSGTWTKQ